MIDIDAGKIDAFLSALTLEQARFNGEISARYRAWVQIIFDDIVELTPQWSGNLASNWRISLSATQEPEVTLPAKARLWPLPPFTDPYKRGDQPAVDIAKARFDDLGKFGYAEQIFIYNPTEIAAEVEAEAVPLRGVNLLDGRVAMIAHAQSYYSVFSPPV